MAPEIDVDGLGESGRTLWESVLADFELDAHEQLLLRQACRTADVLDRLAEEVDQAGALVVEGRKNDTVAHPAAVEHRQQSLAFARLLAALRLPAGEETNRPQRRGGARAPQQTRRGEVRQLRSTS